jgi:hypothetical protein
MIVFETEFGRLVDQIPPIVDAKGNEFPVKYNWGNKDDLFAYLKIAKTNAFPLIWVENTPDIHNLRENSVFRNARINVISIAQVPAEFNPYQYQYDFKEILQPIADKVIDAIKQSGIAMLNMANVNTSRVTKFSLQEVDKSLTYICNAIVMDFDVKIVKIKSGSQSGGQIDESCLNNINF